MLSQVVQDPEQLVDLAVREHRRRLIQDEHPRPGAQRLGDLHHLRLGDAQPVESHVGVQIDAKLLEQGGTVAVKRAPVDQAEPVARLLLQKHVLGHGEGRDGRKLLVDDGDAGGNCLLGSGEDHRFAIQQDLPGRWRIDAGHELDERRFASAVLAAERDSPAGNDLEIDFAEDLVAAEELRHAPCGKHRISHVAFLPGGGFPSRWRTVPRSLRPGDRPPSSALYLG